MQIGERPVSNDIQPQKNLVLFWTAKNSFHSQLTRENFRKYTGNYLTKAGVDYSVHDFVLSKATFPSRQQSSSVNSTFDDFLREFYKSKDQAIQSMSEISAPESYQQQWIEIRNASANGKLVYSVNEKDSVFGNEIINGIVPCAQNESFSKRLAMSFMKRYQLQRIVDSTFSLIEKEIQL